MVVYCGNRLIEVLPKEFRPSVRAIRGGRLLCSDGSLPGRRRTHLLDRRGYFYRLVPLKKRYAFLRWLAPVIDLTKVECAIEVEPPGTIADLAKKAKAWKNSSGRALRRFLAKQNPETVFDESMFRRAWEAMYITLPESEWKQVFKMK